MDSALYPIIWFFLIGFALVVYIILDGFSMGLGLLFPFFGEQERRSIMINTAKPFWDGNQTWIVLAVAALYGAFPLAYSTIMPALYPFLIIFLLAIYLRGIIFEFRSKAKKPQRHFDWLFPACIVIAVLCQGVMLGAMIQGIPVQDAHYSGGPLIGISAFGIFAGLALMIGDALLGAAWLVIKTEGAIQARCYRLIRPLLFALLIAMAIISLWTPWLNDHVAERWLKQSHSPWLWLIPAGILMLAIGIYKSVPRRHEHWLFAQIAVMFALGLASLMCSLYPLIVPPEINIFDAAAHPSSQGFLLVVYLALIPVILLYTCFSYRVFRGKVREGE